MTVKVYDRDDMVKVYDSWEDGESLWQRCMMVKVYDRSRVDGESLWQRQCMVKAKMWT